MENKNSGYKKYPLNLKGKEKKGKRKQLNRN